MPNARQALLRRCYGGIRVQAFLVVAFLLVSAPANSATIAVLDTGIAPIPELTPYIAPGGIDVVTGGFPLDETGHGSVVSSVAILASDFTARILPIKLPFPQTTSEFQVFGINHATANPSVRVLNLSWLNTVFDVPTLDALQRAARNGKVIVMAAGNTAAVNPDFPAGTAGQFNGRALAVGAVDANNVLRPYSARAGAAMHHYVVAPDDAFDVGLAGTSFSAPYVSGLAAQIFEISPFLDADDVVSIIVRTTVDLGAAGVDPIYGHGLVNRAAALAPVGLSAIPSEDSVTGASILFSPRALRVSPAFGFAILDRAGELGSTMILDEYKRPFSVDLSEAVDIADSRASLPFLLSARAIDPYVLNVGDSTFVTRYALPRFEPDLFEYRDVSIDQVSFSMSGRVAENVVVNFSQNELPGLGLGTMGLGSQAGEPVFTTNVFGAPFSTFDTVVDSAGLLVSLTNRVDINFGVVNTDGQDGDHGVSSTAGILEGIYHFSDDLSVSLQVGETIEKGTVFGGASNAVFGVDSASTTAVGLGLRYSLSDAYTVIAQYTHGMTRVQSAADSLLKDFETIESSAFGVALLGDRLFHSQDKLGIAVYRPLRVDDGAAVLNVPHSRDLEGNVLSTVSQVSLEPETNELDVEISYGLPITENVNLDGQMLYQRHPYHTSSVSDRLSGFLRLSVAF